MKISKMDVDHISKACRIAFSGIPSELAGPTETELAQKGVAVFTNAGSHRMDPHVPIIVPEVNTDQFCSITAQDTYGNGGYIVTNANCSSTGIVVPLRALNDAFGLNEVCVSTYQAISGAGKTFETWPEMIDNVIPFIGGEEEKSEQEPMKLWGHIEGDKIVNAAEPNITAQCLRVPVSDGHMAACFVSFKGEKPSLEQIKADWAAFSGRAQELKLPSAPRQFLHYFEEADRPQTKLDRMLEGGMAVSIGRLRPDTQYDYKFVCLSHNTLRGAAGGAVLLAELLCAEGYITKK